MSNSARMYDYWLGGKDSFAVDREAAAAVEEMFPTIRIAAGENRRFVGRAVAAVAELGVRQYLDIGTGLPFADNTHEVAQGVAPESRVVYVDNDPQVMAHARALLTSSSRSGMVDYIEADLRNPDRIVKEAAQALDFEQPVALILAAVLQFIGDDDDPYGIVVRLIDALPSGSFLVLSHPTGDYVSEEVITWAATGPASPVWLRSRDEVRRFLDGLPLLPPDLVSAAEWRAENYPGPSPTVEETSVYSAVARIP